MSRPARRGDLRTAAGRISHGHQCTGLRRIAPWAAATPAFLLFLMILLRGALYREVWAYSVEFATANRNGPPARWSFPGDRLRSQHVSANPIANLADAPGDPTLPHIYLIAHYDSKGQPISLLVRVVLYTLVISGGLSFSCLTLLGLAFPALNPIAFRTGIAVTSVALPLMLLKTSNASPGALDNASGVGLVLSLAKYLAARTDLRSKHRFTVLFYGAEELGNMGAAAYVGRYECLLLPGSRNSTELARIAS